MGDTKMKILFILSVAAGREIDFYKDISALCDESNAKSNCTDDDECNNGALCISTATDNLLLNNIRNAAGPVDLLDEKVCSCGNGHFGPSCSTEGVGFVKCPDENYCKNNGTNNWVSNSLSGCDCKGSHFFGWHCEHDNIELCSHVDHVEMADWVQSEMETTDCGECILHVDCAIRFNLDDAICVHKKSGDMPINFCVVPCTEGNSTEHGICDYDENAGESVWKCHHGYESDCNVTVGCKDRCMNGGENHCDEMTDENDPCVCEDAFFGYHCEKPSECHPAFCDLSISECKLQGEKKVCLPKAQETSGARVSFSLMLSLVSLIELLF